jgi:integrase
MSRKLTPTGIVNAKPRKHPKTDRRGQPHPKAGEVQAQTDFLDSSTPGFGLRVSTTGAKSFIFLYRARSGPGAGKLQRLTIGKVPGTKVLKDIGAALSSAREQARDYRTQVERGGDPKLRLEAEAREAKRLDGNTVEAVVREFIKRHVKAKLRSARTVELALERYVLPTWGDRPITAIARRDVIKLIDSIADAGSPVQANRVSAYLSKLFNWCLSRDIIEASPAVRIEKPAVEVARDRTLDDSEIRQIWAVVDTLPYPFGPCFKLLLITGQRRNEVARMTWAELDGHTWTIPAERTKNKRAHVVPLPDQAVNIVETLPRFAGGDCVFTTTHGRSPISGFGKAKDRITEAVEGIPHWTPHDLRRTAATRMAELGIPGDHIGRVLNHTPRGVTAAVYDKHTYLKEKARALQAWANRLDSIIDGTADNVVAFKG